MSRKIKRINRTDRIRAWCRNPSNWGDVEVFDRARKIALENFRKGRNA